MEIRPTIGEVAVFATHAVTAIARALETRGLLTKEDLAAEVDLAAQHVSGPAGELLALLSEALLQTGGAPSDASIQ